jgi:hypothetical protein
MMALDIFGEINNAVLDLQNSQLQTYERPLKKLAQLLRCRFRRIDLLKIARLITMIILGDRKAGRLSFLPAFIM